MYILGPILKNLFGKIASTQLLKVAIYQQTERANTQQSEMHVRTDTMGIKLKCISAQNSRM